MPAKTVNMFVMNSTGHYFEINTQEVAVNKELLRECRVFDNEQALLEAVCSATGCDLEEVQGTAFYITVDGELTLVDDRGFAHSIDESIEGFITDYEL